jgi:hypothetical protein
MKIIRFVIAIILMLLIIYAVWAFWFVANFHRESFPKSEKYIINLSVDKTISKIKKYKTEYQQYADTVDKVPYEFGYFTEIKYDGNANVTTSTRTSKSTWYSCRFYLEQINAVVGCRIKLNQYPVEIMLVSVSFSNEQNKTINEYKEITCKENKMVKKQFETAILNKIYSGEWKHKRWYN